MRMTNNVAGLAVLLVMVSAAVVSQAKQTLVAEYIVPTAQIDNWESPNKIFLGYNTETNKGFTFKRKGPTSDGFYNYYFADTRLGGNYNAVGCWISPEQGFGAKLPDTYTRSLTSAGSPSHRYIYQVHYDGLEMVDYETKEMEGWIAGQITSAALEGWIIANNLDSSGKDYNWRHSNEHAPYVQCIHYDYVYMVTFDAGECHAGEMPAQHVTNSAALATCSFRCPGCKFSGWATQSGGSVVYKDGETIGARGELTDDLCLHAVWEPITYSIQFNGNGGTGYQTPIANVKYHETVVIPDCNYSWAGYEFSGWATNQNGKVLFGKGDIVNNLTTVDKFYVTLYASWSPLAKVQVAFDAAPGTVVGENPREYTPGVKYGDFPSATRVGFDFTYWADALAARVYSETLVPAGNHTLYARWKGIEYDVYFYDDAQSLPLGNQTGFVYGEARALKTVAELHFSRAGYDFVGWSTNESNRIAVYADGAVVSNLTTASETDLYAVMTNSPSYLVFDPATNAVSGTMPVQECSCLSTVRLASNVFERVGYKFSGWSTTPGGKIRYGNGAEYEAAASHAHKTNVLYAVWGANRYTVTFDANGGESEPAPKTKEYVYDAPYGTLATVTNVEGVAFAGWYTEKEGGALVTTNSPVAITNDATFYAHWRQAPFALTFDAQGGGFTNGLQTLTIADRYFDGEPYAAFPEVTNAADRVFAGWWDSTNLVSRTQQLTNDCASLALKTLYARWKTVKEKPEVKVTFDANGGTGTVMWQRREGTELGALPDEPTRDGFRFVGWFVNKTEGGARVDKDAVVHCTTNYFARWSDRSLESVLGTYDGVAFSTDPENGWFEETDAAYKRPGAAKTLRSGAIATDAMSTLWAYVPNVGGTFRFNRAVSATEDSLLQWIRGENRVMGQVVGVNMDWTVEERVECTGASAKVRWKYYRDTIETSEVANRAWLSGFTWTQNPVVSPIDDWATNAVRANLTFETGGAKPWKLASATNPEEGIRTDAIGNGEFTWVRATAKGPGVLTFRWRTDCEGGFVSNGVIRLTDRLELRVDGEAVAAIGGSNDWSTVALTNETAAAHDGHCYEWRYVKDDDTSVGADAAWLDAVVWEPLSPVHPVPGPQDARDFAAVAMVDGTLRLSLTNADERFDYLLRGTNELESARPWPTLWTTNGAGNLVIEPPRTDHPQMFYYLQTLQRKQ